MGNGRKIRQGLAGVFGRVPASRVELGELGPGHRIGTALPVGRAIERIVVQQERYAVTRKFDVELDHSVTVRETSAHGGEGVFGGELAAAAMRDEPRIGPRRHAVNRAPDAASNR